MALQLTVGQPDLPAFSPSLLEAVKDDKTCLELVGLIHSSKWPESIKMLWNAAIFAARVGEKEYNMIWQANLTGFFKAPEFVVGPFAYRNVEDSLREVSDIQITRGHRARN